MTRRPITVLVADDDAYLADLFTRRVVSHGFRALSPVTRLKEIPPALMEGNPGILILDVKMEGKNSLDTLKSLRIRFPRLRVIVVTGYRDICYVQQALALACEGMLWKSDLTGEEMREALHALALRRTYLSPDIRPLDTRIHCRPIRPLTEKQYRLFAHLRHWEPQVSIAKRFRTSQRSIEIQVRKLRQRLGLQSEGYRVNWANIVIGERSPLDGS